MTSRFRMAAALAAAALACTVAPLAPAAAQTADKARVITLTVATKQGPRVFEVEAARDSAAQERGLMFRTNLPDDGGMLFAPYPPDGPPREASFWMVNTPSPLDIVFIRADGTIARIAADAVPYSEDLILSGEPVAAVLEIAGGRAAALGIAAGDRVSWKKRKRGD